MNLRLPEEADAKLAARAAREHRSKHDLILDAINEANDRAEMTIDSVLDELFITQAKTIERLK